MTAAARELVGVVGAGTMGSGIAQVAAVAGHPVLVHDAVPGAAERVVGAIRESVAALVARGRLDADPDALRLSAAASVAGLADASVVIEAVVEDLAAKRALFAELEAVVAPECVLATNTSSLSPGAIAAGLTHPQRVVGLHFFNPVPRMKLVEVVPGPATDAAVTERAGALATSWGKTVVRSAPAPGFIVNRLARPFYAEAWRLYEQHAAEPAVIDAVLTGAAGFRMGPFALMDLIGHDVNEAVTRTVWAGFGRDPWFAPPPLAQRQLVEAGWLGRKSGRGVYDYAAGALAADAEPEPACAAPAGVTENAAMELRVLLRRSGVPTAAGDGPAGFVALPGGALLGRTTGVPATIVAADVGRPVVLVDRTLDDGTATAIALAVSAGCGSVQRAEAVGLLQAAGLAVHVVDDAPGLIVARTVAMLINLAVDARHRQLASAPDIDTAMRLGTSYPLGPLEWGERWGPPVVVAILDGLLRSEGDPRYRASTLLRRRAVAGLGLG